MKSLTAACFIAASLLAHAAANAQSLGGPAPALDITDFSNSPDKISLEALKGRIVVLALWRTSDSASLAAIDTLNKIHRDFRRSGVVVIGLTPEEKGKAESTVTAKKIEYIVGYGGNVDELFKVTAYPQVFLIDTLGTIAWRGHPADDLEQRVKDQIRRTPPAGSDSEALRARLTKAQSLMGKKEFAKAYTLAKSVSSVAVLGDPIGEQAKTMLTKIEEGAMQQLETARQLSRDAKNEEACRMVAEVSVRMEGTPVAHEAGAEIGRLRTEKATHDMIRTALENARGELKNDEAADFEAGKQYADAIAAFAAVAEQYPNLDAGKAAKAAIERINGDKTVQQYIQKQRREAQADRWLDIGDRYAKVELFDLAREYYTRVNKQFAGTPAADKAAERMAKLPRTATSAPAGG